MTALDRKVKVTDGNCGTSLAKQHLSRHKSSCSGGTLYCPDCPNFSTKSGDDLSYHIAKKIATPGVKRTHKCKICFKEFSVSNALRQHKNTQHSGFGASKIHVGDRVRDVDGRRIGILQTFLDSY